MGLGFRVQDHKWEFPKIGDLRKCGNATGQVMIIQNPNDGPLALIAISGELR